MHWTTIGRNLFLGASLIAVGTGQALAQDEPQAGDTIGQGEIIVTAQRRSENLRDVPISVTALNAETLSRAGVTNTLDIGRVTPGVVIPLYGSYTLPSIRGISSSGAGMGDSTNVAIYIDGVYQANTNAQLADLPNVQSIQILKGPQGTLYGQNAAGGAIIVDTVKPSFTLGGKFEVGYGNFDDRFARGFITGPLSDTLAFMVAGNARKRDGIRRDILYGGHDAGLESYQVRGKLLWEPSDGVSLTFQGDYNKRNDTSAYAGQALRGNSLGTLYKYLPCDFGGLGAPANPASGCAAANVPIADSPRETSDSPRPETNIETYGFAMLGKFEIGELGTLNTVSAYNHRYIENRGDVDKTPVNIGDFKFNVRERDFIQELNFISNDLGGLTFAAGAFFMDKVEEYRPNTFQVRWPFSGTPTVFPALPDPLPYNVFAGNLGDNVAKNKKKSYAVYGELTYELTDQLSVTAAGRYSWETQLLFNTPLPDGWRFGDPLPTPVVDHRGEFKFSQFTPRAVVRFKPNNDHTFYASYSKGFKSGFVNNNNINACKPRNPQTGLGQKNPDGSDPCVDDPVTPETVDAFEIGYKGRISNRLNLSLSAFHYKYKGIQVFIYNPVLGSSYQNAAAGEINGLEVEGNLFVSSELTFNFGAAYLDSKYTSFPNAQAFRPIDCTMQAGIGAFYPAGSLCGNTQGAEDATGNQLMRTPKWTANASINYEHEFSAGTLGAYLGGNYNSGVYYDPINRIKQKPYALVDAELSFAPAAIEGLRLVLWGKNLTDRDYLQSVLESQLADFVSYADPRTYGVRVEFTF